MGEERLLRPMPKWESAMNGFIQLWYLIQMSKSILRGNHTSKISNENMRIICRNQYPYDLSKKRSFLDDALTIGLD